MILLNISDDVTLVLKTLQWLLVTLRLRGEVFTVDYKALSYLDLFTSLIFSVFRLCPFTPTTLDSLEFLKLSSNTHLWAIALAVLSTWNILVLISTLLMPHFHQIFAQTHLTSDVIPDCPIEKSNMCPTPTLTCPSYFPYFCL